jgi:hypothetical protein
MSFEFIRQTVNKMNESMMNNLIDDNVTTIVPMLTVNEYPDVICVSFFNVVIWDDDNYSLYDSDGNLIDFEAVLLDRIQDFYNGVAKFIEANT